MEIIVNTKKNLFLRVTQKEATILIKSLSSQIVANSPNVGRSEMYTDKGVDVSIAVEDISPTTNYGVNNVLS